MSYDNLTHTVINPPVFNLGERSACQASLAIKPLIISAHTHSPQKEIIRQVLIHHLVMEAEILAEMGKVKNRGLLMRAVRGSICAPPGLPVQLYIHHWRAGGAITVLSVNPK